MTIEVKHIDFQNTIENGVNSEVLQVLVEYNSLGSKFKEPPEVQLSLVSQNPDQEVGSRDIVITTAIQCYSPGKAVMKQRERPHEIGIATSTLQAGHHTTRMHGHFTWRIAGLTRAQTHDVFHSHPYYNSEQQSQRYVKAEKGSVLRPSDLTAEQEQIYEEAANSANEAYFELLELLPPVLDERLKQIYPANAWSAGNKNRERMENKRQKISQEVARYVLPIGQTTNFFHTLSHLQLLRMWRASKMPHFSDEGRYVIGQMVKSVAEVDPTILNELELPIEPNVLPTVSNEEVKEFNRRFDLELDGNVSVDVQIPDTAQEILADAIRGVLGKSDLQEDEALEIALSPRKNPLLADVYDVGIQDPLTATLRQISLSYKTKLSHTADSQRQRHRRTPGAVPGEVLYSGEPDFMTPMVIMQSEVLNAKYQEIMLQMYKNVDDALAAGIPRDQAFLLLPNAHAMRVRESGDLFDWVHRWKQRLCFLAQEEIFFVTVDQVRVLNDKLPQARQLLQAPCGLRKDAGKKPFCPEGDRFCGQPVYHWQVEDYSNQRMV